MTRRSAQDDTACGTEASGYFNTLPGSTATGNVLANDVDDGGQPALVVTSVRVGPEANPGLAGLVGGEIKGLHGTLVLNEDGSFSYTIDDNDMAVQALNIGDTITDTFTCTTRDLGNLTDRAQLVVTINGANDNAVISGIASGTVVEAGGTLNGTLNTRTASADLYHTDVDNSWDVWQAVGAGTASDQGYGTYSFTSSGVWTYTLRNGRNAVQKLNVGDTLTDTFTVLTEDGTPQQVSITIEGANDAPVGEDDTSFSLGATAATEKGGTNNGGGGANATGNVLRNDTDVDDVRSSFVVSAFRTGGDEGLGNSGTVGFGLVGAHGTLTLNANGKYTYVVNEDDAAVQAMNVGGTITDTFNYTVMDPGGLVDTAVLTITINGANDAPVAAERYE